MPAIVFKNKSKSWFKNGYFHRENGPSFEGQNGYREWRQNGKRHRLDGPAVAWCDGTNSWYLNDEKPLEVKNQNIMGNSIVVGKDIAIVIRCVEGVFYEALLGNKKILIVKVS